MKLYADGHGDKDNEGPIEMLQHRPQEGMLQRNIRRPHKYRQKSGIEGRHFQKVAEEFGNRSAPASNQGSTKHIHRHIHDNHKHRHGSQSFCQIGMAVSFRKGRMTVNQHNQCSADMAGIGKGGYRTEFIELSLLEVKKAPQTAGKEELYKKEQHRRCHRRHFHAASPIAVKTVENEAGEHHQYGELAVGGNINFEFAVQKPSGSDENEKWKNIIPQNGKKNHGTPLMDAKASLVLFLCKNWFRKRAGYDRMEWIAYSMKASRMDQAGLFRFQPKEMVYFVSQRSMHTMSREAFSVVQ